MQLELSTEEAQELTTVLANALAGLRNEVDHTDDRAYRRGLRADVHRLDAIWRRLAALRAGEPTPPGVAAESSGPTNDDRGSEPPTDPTIVRRSGTA